MMRSLSSHHGLSPQQLLATLHEARSREKELWRKQLLSDSVNKVFEVGPTQRDFAVTWMSQLNGIFNFYPETLFQAVHTLDRFLTVVKSQPKYLKCIAVTCLYIASKLSEEEEYIPSTKELVELSECGCRAKDILRMERIILTKLDWELHTPTPLTYLEIFHALLFSNRTKGFFPVNVMLEGVVSQNLYLAQHLNHLTRELQFVICNYSFAAFSSPIIALTIISHAIEASTLEASQRVIIESHIQDFAKIEAEDLIDCRYALLSHMEKNQRVPSFHPLVYYVVSYTSDFTREANDVMENKNNASIHQERTSKQIVGNIHTQPALHNTFKNLPQTSDVDDTSVTLVDNIVSNHRPLTRVEENIAEAQDLPNLAHGSTLLSQGNQVSLIDNTVTNCADMTSCNNLQLHQVLACKEQHNNSITVCKEQNEESSSHAEEMESDGYDSDKTLTASEGEDEEYIERKKHGKMQMRPLTYAEIVKCGILESAALSV